MTRCTFAHSQCELDDWFGKRGVSEGEGCSYCAALNACSLHRLCARDALVQGTDAWVNGECSTPVATGPQYLSQLTITLCAIKTARTRATAAIAGSRTVTFATSARFAMACL